MPDLLRPVRRALVVVAALVLALGLAAVPASAHEIPARVTVLVHAVRDSGALRVWLRVPLAAMRDVDFPLRPDGTLRLDAVEPAAREAAELWLVELLGPRRNGAPLSRPQLVAVRVVRPSNGAFASRELVQAHFAAPPETTIVDLPATQALLDVALVYPDVPATGTVTLVPQVARLGVETRTVLHLTEGTAAERRLVVEGDPGELPFTPGRLDAAARFTRLGVAHILDGIDHLLFLLCLVLPMRGWRPLVAAVTAFTLAHSITLVGAALGLVPQGPWFAPLVELLIAASIVVLAIENLLGARVAQRWRLAFGFGLVHGVGFASALRESLQFAGEHLVLALGAFNLGVELGQLGVLLVTVPLLTWAWRLGVPERAGVMVASAFVAHEAWHWTAERWTVWRAVPWERPVFDAAAGASVVSLLLLGVVAWGVATALGVALRRWPVGSAAADPGAQQPATAVR